MIVIYKFFSLIGISILVSLIMGTIIFFTATDNDISNLPKDPTFSTTTLSSTGYGDILPISNSFRIFITLYMFFVSIGIITFLVDVIDSKI